MKPFRILILIFCVVLAGGGFWWWRYAGERQAIVARALPAVPDLSPVLPVLRDRIVAAQQRARSRFTASPGLAELSRLYHANGFLDEAARCYTGLEELAPTEARWLHRHATILAGYGEIADGTRLWRQVIRLAPDYIPARLRLGDCLLKSNQNAEAATAYADVLRINPDNSYALLGLARIDLEAGRWDQARTRLEAVVSQTNYSLGYDLIVSLYERLGLREQAAAIRGANKASGAYRDPPDPWLEELNDDCFDSYRLSLAAGLATSFHDRAKAVSLLERAIALAPEDVSCHFQLGCLSVEQHNIPVAREQLELCTTLAPDFSDGWARLSDLQAQIGENLAAESTLTAGLKHCPSSPGLHLMRARNLRKAGRGEEAVNEFLISIRLRPNEPDALVELGSLYIETGRVGEGVQKLNEALDADPGDPAALGILAFYAVSTANETESRRWLERVVNQPRVPREQVGRLLDAYRQTFGRDLVPAKGGE